MRTSAASCPEPGLFRPRAVAARRPGMLGEIVIVSPVSFNVLSVAAAAIACAIVGFFVWGTYTQHSTLTGRLVPDLGVIRVHAPQVGTIVERNVHEGDRVERGELLYLISSERMSGGLRATHRLVGIELERRHRSLATQLEHTKALERTERESLEKISVTLAADSANIDRMLASQRERLALADNAAARYARLREEGFVSEDALAARREAAIEQRSALRGLERERSDVERRLADLAARLSSLPLETRNALAELERAMAATRQELTENEARRHVAVTAPAAGLVTSVVGTAGQAVDGSRPLAAIVPAGAHLRAELYAPSRAIGFIEPGDTALLRYQAYPYQKFGHHRATIESVTRATAPVADLAATGVSDPAATAEPVYRVTLVLPAQSIEAYGRAHELQAGMVVEADVLHETRRLYEWMLEPLYSLTRKLP